MTDSKTALMVRLGHEFKDSQLLTAALTHRSVLGVNNERLEFLGDSILNFIIAEALFLRCPHAREGELSRLRATLVKGETLAVIARELNLGGHLHLGSGEMKTGGHRRNSILADALEAIIAAIYLDDGIDKAKHCILTWYDKRLENVHKIKAIKDAKTLLQEYLQSKGLSLPNYEVTKITGQAHKQTFYVRCFVDAIKAQSNGTGSSRRRAEQDAANALLKELEKG